MEEIKQEDAIILEPIAEDSKEIDNKRVRFSDAEWTTVHDIVVGGAGGIGSWLIFYLARIGHNLYIYDNDSIDETNMAGQLYSIAMIGRNKAEAMKHICNSFSGSTNINTFSLYDEDNGLYSPIMISCFDNMNARKVMFEKWAGGEDREVFIDGRMLAETGMVFCVLKGQEDAYRRELFDDSEVEEAPCSFKATSHCGAFIAALMVSNLNNYLANKHIKADIRIIQFRTDFELPLMSVAEFNSKNNES